MRKFFQIDGQRTFKNLSISPIHLKIFPKRLEQEKFCLPSLSESRILSFFPLSYNG